MGYITWQDVEFLEIGPITTASRTHGAVLFSCELLQADSSGFGRGKCKPLFTRIAPQLFIAEAW